MKKRTFISLIILSCIIGMQAQTFSGSPTMVDAAENTGREPSLAIINGNPAISYYKQWSGSDLYYVRAFDPSGNAWNTPVVVFTPGAVGRYSCLSVINDNPAISFHDGSNGTLRYVRANDINGTNWGSSQVIDGYGSFNYPNGQWTSMTTVNGHPAVSYYHSSKYAGSFEDLRYIRANDPNGASWGAATVVDHIGNVGSTSSMAVVNGNPAISYYDATNGNLKYVRATDAIGSKTSWSYKITIDATGDVGSYTSLVVVNGNPAISYYDVTHGDLKYVRALDVDGATWGTPVTVDASSANVGQYTSMVIWDDRPAISYYDATNGDLKLAVALDLNGTTWGIPSTADATGNAGLGTSLKVVGSSLAIAYREDGGQDLKFVQGSIAFPVELISFSGLPEKENILLSWETASELNNRGFYIERSESGELWTELGFITGNGTSSTAQTFEFEDLKPLSGIQYYRLKQVDFNGNAEYSLAISIRFTPSYGAIRIFPNPARNQLFFKSSISGHILVVNLIGQTLIQKEVNNQDNVNISGLEDGVYFIIIKENNGAVESKRFMVAH